MITFALKINFFIKNKTNKYGMVSESIEAVC
jgi:hypothetical protein